MSDISRNLKHYRKKRGLSQEALAEKLCVTRQAVSQWETDRSYPDLDTVVRLADVLGTDVNALLYPPDKKASAAQVLPVTLRSVVNTFFVMCFLMTWGSGIPAMLLQKIMGDGVAETYLYPIYWGIILLACIMVGCTALICETVQGAGRAENQS